MCMCDLIISLYVENLYETGSIYVFVIYAYIYMLCTHVLQ